MRHQEIVYKRDPERERVCANQPWTYNVGSGFGPGAYPSITTPHAFRARARASQSASITYVIQIIWSRLETTRESETTALASPN